MNIPERTMGTMCRIMVERGHIGYQCTLSQGHEDNFAEPHYAIEVDHSARTWSKWYDQRQAAAQKPISSREDEDRLLLEHPVLMPDGIARMGGRSQADHEADLPSVYESRQKETDAAFMRLGVTPPKDPMEDVNAAHMKAMGLGDVKLGEPLNQQNKPDANPDRCRATFTDNPRFRCVLKGGHTLGHLRGTVRWPQQVPVAEPTKQRDGDQILPTGGEQCVQDLVIERMQESKRVGVERYGSPLMTFNGRKGIQDVAEEVRDLFVYITAIEAEAKADREALIGVVQQAFLAESQRTYEDHMQRHDLATLAVDRVMGWVVAQRMAPHVG